MYFTLLIIVYCVYHCNEQFSFVFVICCGSFYAVQLKYKFVKNLFLLYIDVKYTPHFEDW